MRWRVFVRASRKFTFICPSCGRLSKQNNTVVDETTDMRCHNVDKHKGGGVRRMKVQKHLGG